MRELRVGGGDGLDVEIEGDARGAGQGCGLGQRASGRLDQRRFRVGVQHGRFGQHAERPGAEVERELAPDRGADVLGLRHLQVGGLERGGQFLQTRGCPTVGLPEQGAAADAGHQADHAGRGDRAGGPENAADRALRADRAPQGAARVQGGQLASVQVSAMGVEIPPRDAVHDEGHGGVGTQQRSDGGGDGGQGGCLDCDDHHVLRPEIGGIGAGGRMRDDAVVPQVQGQAVGPDRLQMCPAGDDRDLVGRGLRQAAREIAADRAGAEDTDPHLGSFMVGLGPVRLVSDLETRIIDPHRPVQFHASMFPRP